LGSTITKTRSAWKYGHLVWRGEVDDNRCNLLVAPPEAEIQLALAGRLDTVTPYDLDHYEAEQTIQVS